MQAEGGEITLGVGRIVGKGRKPRNFYVTIEVVETIASLGRPIVDLSTEIIPRYVGRILCVETRGYHRDIGTPESLARAIADMTPRSSSRANVA